MIRANLEYSIVEDERIVTQLGNKTALLEETLNSHRFAISLNPTNTDILFNAAQVLTSLAEASLESKTQESAKLPARESLEEAVDIFKRCLESQQREYEQMQAEIAKAQASGEYQEAWGGGGVSLSDEPAQQEPETGSNVSETPGEWATVEEPVTPEAILETCTAQLSALTTLLGLYDPSDLSNIEKKAQDGTETATAKIPALINLIDTTPSLKAQDEPKAGPTLSIGVSTVEEASTTPKDDAVLAVANFQAIIAEVAYRSGRTSSTEYAQTIERTFSKMSPGIEAASDIDPAKANILSSYADALIDLASALADGIQYIPSSPTFSTDVEIQWTALTQSQNFLSHLATVATTLHLSATRLADIFLARGDTDLFRFRIALFEQSKPSWSKDKMTLVGNAGVFYRGARSYAEKAGAVEVCGVADAKAVVAEILKEVASGSEDVKETWKGKSAIITRVLEQMVEEGIVGMENVDGVVRLVQ